LPVPSTPTRHARASALLAGPGGQACVNALLSRLATIRHLSPARVDISLCCAEWKPAA
jgi:hypothetical protein